MRQSTVAQAPCLPYREPPACHAEAGSKPAIRQTGRLRYDHGAKLRPHDRGLDPADNAAQE